MTEIEVFALDGISLVIALIQVDGLRLTVQNHQPTLIATSETNGLLCAVLVIKLAIDTLRIKRNLLLREPKLKL